MIYPIVAFGDPVLKARAKDIPAEFEAAELKQLIADMFDTMYHAHGVGLAAPQIGKSIRLFVIDSTPMVEEEDEDGQPVEPSEPPVKRAFINPTMVSETGDEWGFEEGCLSIPGVREMVYRHETIVIRYHDENLVQHEDTFSGMTARVIQHEYDHLEGVLFTDKISGFKKQLIKGKLTRISKGDVKADYRMRFAGAGRK
ncbi:MULTISPECIES: peptide deformylase [Hymenobacter]|uniref:Peptide deformylase n=1 Tax=Hymenobacter jejuensis TaxID=2502781 RepID=A0A5B8A0F5_9BACT|nr:MULTISPECIES: peptide deformylase [Hymenobacter]MBC6992414.1 peptide deformylase [Hymenobacter sp. BT491]QDA60296.1 peptide deformylase [Hymenobacter jejuensis]